MTALLLFFAFISHGQSTPLIAAETAPQPTIVPDAVQIADWVAQLAANDIHHHEAARLGLMKAGPRAKGRVEDLVKIASRSSGRPDYAVEVLGAIGAEAKAALPALLSHCKPVAHHDGLLDSAAIAVTRIGGPRVEVTYALLHSNVKGSAIYLEDSKYLRAFPELVVPHLVELCRSKEKETRIRAATVIGHLNGALSRGHESKTILARAGQGANDIPAALEMMLADEDARVRITAAQAIATSAPQVAEKCIPVVIAAMQNGQLSPKSNQYQAAGIFRPVPEKAAEALRPFLAGEDEDMRHWAVQVLAHLRAHRHVEAVLRDGVTAREREAAALCFGTGHMSAEIAVPPLVAALSDKDLIVRFAAARGVVTYTRKRDVPVEVVSVLLEGLKHTDLDIRLAAVKNLVDVGAPAKNAVPHLLKLLDEPTLGLTQEVALALVAISPADAAPAVPTLTRALAIADDIRFVEALAALGPAAKPALPELLNKFDSQNSGLRIAATEAAARIEPALTMRAVAVLIPLLTDPKRKYSYDRGEVAMALARIGPRARGAAPTLQQLLRDDGPYHAEIALAAVSVDPEGAKAAREWLQKQLVEDGGDAYDIAEIIPDLGRGAKVFLPELRTMLGLKSQQCRTRAVQALAGVGPDGKQVLTELKVLAATDPSARVRTLAADAVKSLEGK